jgi:hypothetical protein
MEKKAYLKILLDERTDKSLKKQNATRIFDTKSFRI